MAPPGPGELLVAIVAFVAPWPSEAALALLLSILTLKAAIGAGFNVAVLAGEAAGVELGGARSGALCDIGHAPVYQQSKPPRVLLCTVANANLLLL